MAKFVGYLAAVTLLATLMVTVSSQAQEPAPATEEPQSAGGPQQLELSEAVARDVLEPLQAGMQNRELKQVLAVFDSQSVPDYPQLRDRVKALLDAYAAVQFRYKILQSSSENSRASVTCEFDLDGTPVDSGQVPMRRSTQMRLQLTQTSKGWRIAAFSPSDFFGS